MNIILYKNYSSKETVNKAISQPMTRDCKLKGAFDIMHPTFVVTRADNEFFIGYNYAYIPEWGKYYEMTVTVDIGNTAILQMDEDVLMTFRNGINNTTALVERQENFYNPYLSDPLVPIANGTIIDTIVKPLSLPSGNARTTYLTCIGGISE